MKLRSSDLRVQKGHQIGSILHPRIQGETLRKLLMLSGVPDGIRTRVTAVKGRCPRPLDDGDSSREQTSRMRLGQ